MNAYPEYVIHGFDPTPHSNPAALAGKPLGVRELGSANAQ
jgi:hypothetical protein